MKLVPSKICRGWWPSQAYSPGHKDLLALKPITPTTLAQDPKCPGPLAWDQVVVAPGYHSLGLSGVRVEHGTCSCSDTPPAPGLPSLPNPQEVRLRPERPAGRQGDVDNRRWVPRQPPLRFRVRVWAGGTKARPAALEPHDTHI